jgi:hypothetical protein
MGREGANMVLEIPGKILGQDDVRETPASTAEANAFTFDTDDFTDTAGAISLKNKTSYYAVSPSDFIAENPDTDNYIYGIAHGNISTSVDSISYIAPVHLPQGAVVTACIVHGSAGATAESWTLKRATHDNPSGVTMGTANFDTADSTIANATIANQTYYYFISTSTLDTNDQIYGGVITYTTDYD